MKHITLAVFLSLALTACSNQATSSVSSSDVQQAKVAATQTIDSLHHELQLTTAPGFSALDDVNASPIRTAPGQKLILAQHNLQSGITLYAASVEAHHVTENDYFQKLTQLLESKKETFDNVAFSGVKNARMTYRFSHDGLNEQCTALWSESQLYSVCAVSETANFGPIEQVVKAIKITAN